MEIDFLKINKEFLEENFFIIRLGNENRPATEKDFDDFHDSWKKFIKILDLDSEPAVFLTHHAITISKQREIYSICQLEELRDSIDNKIDKLKNKDL